MPLAGSLTLGGISYDILANDLTKPGTDSAIKNIDDVGVHYSDTLSNIAFNFNMITQAAQTAYNFLKQGWNETIGVAERYQDEMDDMHNMFGISIEDAQKWRAAAIATDTDMGSLSITMRYLTQRVTDQSEAGEKLRGTLSAIGVETKTVNGEWKDSSDLLQEVIVALNRIPEGSARANISAEILGRNWYRLADMIENADTAVKEFEKTQSTMTEEESDKIEKFKIKWAQLADKIELAKVNLGLWVIESAEAHQEMNEGDVSYLDQFFGKMFPYKGEYARGGAGGRSGDEIKAGADWTNKEVESVALLTDKYNGMSQSQIELAKSQKELITLEAAYMAALSGNSQDVLDAASLAYWELRNHIQEMAEAESGEKDRINSLTDAYKDYESAIKRVNDAKQDYADMNADYATAMQNAGRDVGEMRRLTIQHAKDEREASQKMTGLTDESEAVTTRYTAIKSGVPLEQIPGTEQYTAAQATAGYISPATKKNEILDPVISKMIKSGSAIPQSSDGVPVSIPAPIDQTAELPAPFRAKEDTPSPTKMTGSGDYSITIGTVNLTKAYDFPSLMKDIETWQQTKRKQMGVRTS
ncbi:MAG: hypothetical protein WCX48_08070 [Bacteroidales bacterium]|jgi:hypothetical protein